MDLMLDSSLDNADEGKIERDAEVANKEAGALSWTGSIEERKLS